MYEIFAMGHENTIQMLTNGTKISDSTNWEDDIGLHVPYSISKVPFNEIKR